MRKIFKKHIQGKKVVIIFIITNLVYFCMLFLTIPKVMDYTHGMDLFDMMPAGYSVEYAQTLLNTLGTDGRRAYLHTQLPVDMIYPLFFGLTYSLILAYFLNKLNWLEKPIFFTVLLPLIAGLFDYAENIGIFTMLQAYPDFSVTEAALTNSFTIIKSVLSTVSFVILLILLIIFLVRRMNPHKLEANS